MDEFRAMDCHLAVANGAAAWRAQVETAGSLAELGRLIRREAARRAGQAGRRGERAHGAASMRPGTPTMEDPR